MSSSELERLARGGLQAVPGDRLADLAVWCRDRGELTGDARFSSWRHARSIDAWRQEHEEMGGVPAAVLDEIDREVRNLLPAIIELESPADAASLARVLRERVQGQLLGPHDW
ncbi:MAG: hypothetical protein IPM45_14550 [Acidimicrobiales bacterium]|nr:hypothetical protein [Acidimicrobiales bacterium]